MTQSGTNDTIRHKLHRHKRHNCIHMTQLYTNDPIRHKWHNETQMAKLDTNDTITQKCNH